MKIPYSFFPDFVVRAPRFPFTASVNEQQADELLENAAFLESVYLASPVLYNECIKYRNGQIQEHKDILKLKRTIIKYYLRSVSRCTPFGLFSGCAVGHWSAAGTGLVMDSAVERHTRFDMHYLCALSQHLAARPGIKEHLRYFTNNSYYSIGDEIRYVDYKYVSGARIHQISAVNSSSYLEAVLTAAMDGITITGLRQVFADSDASEEDVLLFIDELVAAQLLVSELEPAITGDEYMHQLAGSLKRIQAVSGDAALTEVIQVLEAANEKLLQADAAAVNDAAVYREIVELVSRLGVVHDEGKLFQMDMKRSMLKGGLPERMQEQLFDALGMLNRLNNHGQGNPNLRSFIKRFYERYEEKEMPLLEVLDTETGIGYIEAGADEHAPLVADIVFTTINPTQNYQWGPVEKFLMRKVSEAYHEGSMVIELKEEDTEFLNSDRYDDLPPSMHLMFRVVNTGTEQLFIENCGGSSAAALLGRFAHADEGIRNLLDKVIEKEEALNPDVLFAEIIHLPESRTGNVLLHPCFRKYEIPYLARAAVDAACQVKLQDLLVSVRQGKVILRSAKTGRIILPRLSSAHNYQYNALPVYQFLCDMQLQQQRGAVGFSWGSITHLLKSLPRIQYKNTILSPATWRLTRMDFAHLLDIKGEARRYKMINEFTQKWKLPKVVVLADGDNELLIDFESDVLVHLFLETIRKSRSLEMREFFYPDARAVTDEQSRVYANQVVAVLVKEETAYRLNGIVKSRSSSSASPHSATAEWLYYKIYCGVKSADKILTDAIRPVTEELAGAGLLDHFFFIRFNDPLFHIRFRVRLSEGSSMVEAARLVEEHIAPFRASGHIWKVQTDTYAREMERYGAATIGYAEQIFYHDSVSVLRMLCETWGDEREHVRWLWAMRSVDSLLDLFEITPEEKLKICDSMRLSFASEFNADSFLKEQLSIKYRANRDNIENIMNRRNDGTDSILGRLVGILDEKAAAAAPVAQALLHAVRQGLTDVALYDLLSSYIHMLINRVIATKARLHEMVIYDFLYRHYKAAIAQAADAAKRAGKSAQETAGI